MRRPSHALSVVVTDIPHLTAADFTALEDVIDDYLGGSFSEAYDVLMEAQGNGNANGSDIADLADDIAAFQAAQDAADGCARSRSPPSAWRSRRSAAAASSRKLGTPRETLPDKYCKLLT